MAHMGFGCMQSNVPALEGKRMRMAPKGPLVSGESHAENIPKSYWLLSRLMLSLSLTLLLLLDWRVLLANGPLIAVGLMRATSLPYRAAASGHVMLSTESRRLWRPLMADINRTWSSEWCTQCLRVQPL